MEEKKEEESKRTKSNDYYSTVPEKERSLLNVSIVVLTSLSSSLLSTHEQPMRFKQGQFFVDPSHVLVDVRAILWPVIAVCTPEMCLVQVAMGAVVAHHTVFGQESVRATRTLEPTVMIHRLYTCNHGLHINNKFRNFAPRTIEGWSLWIRSKIDRRKKK